MKQEPVPVFPRVKAYPLTMMSALSAMDLISGISNSYAFNGFQKGGRINIQPIKDWLEINILLLWYGIMAVFGQDNQIAIIPFHDIHIPLQTIWCPKANIIIPKTEGGKAPRTAEYSLMVVWFNCCCHGLNVFSMLQNYEFLPKPPNFQHSFCEASEEREVRSDEWEGSSSRQGTGTCHMRFVSEKWKVMSDATAFVIIRSLPFMLFYIICQVVTVEAISN